MREGIEAGVLGGRNVPAAGRAVLSLGTDVARRYTDRMRPSPRALGQQYADLVLRVPGPDPAWHRPSAPRCRSTVSGPPRPFPVPTREARCDHSPMDLAMTVFMTSLVPP